MIVNILQTKTSFDMEWRAQAKGGRTVSVGKSPFEKGVLRVEIDYMSRFAKTTLYFNPSDTTWGSSLTERATFKLMENGERVGSICGKTKRVGFLRAYAYYEVTYGNKAYSMYEVGLGSRGIFLCIYDGTEQVAMVEKKLQTVNYRDSYTAYLTSEEYLNIVIPTTIYYDITMFGDQMEYSVADKKQVRKNTLQKEVLEKYDSTFIPKIVAMEDGTVN